MKLLVRLAAFVFLWGVMFHLSCTKEYSCEGCWETNKPPVADAGGDTIIVLPVDSIKLDGSGSTDPDGTITEFLWTKISGPASFNINNASAGKTNAGNLTAGTYQFELKVEDNGGLTAKDTMSVIVDSVLTTNHPPVANAGADQTLTLPRDSINIDGSGSTDPENNIANYAWTKISGPSSFNITGANEVQALISNLAEGIYQFELKVTDAEGLFSKDTMLVTVNDAISNNIPPVARAGNDTIIQSNQTSCAPLPIAITLNGNNSYDQDGTIVSYSWTEPNGIANPNAAVTTVNGLVSGTTWFILKVTDNKGAFSFDTLKITVIPANRPLVPAQLISIGTLSQARHGVAVAAAGNKILFAGGLPPGNSPATAKVDIYDIVTGVWTTAQLSQARFNIGVAVLGSKIFFAGGIVPAYSNSYNGWIIVDSFTYRSSVIDIYDVSNNTWSTGQLSNQRAPVGASVNNKVVFAGSDVSYQFPALSATIDIYNTGTNTRSSTLMSEARDLEQPAVGGSKMYFAGGSRDFGFGQGFSGGLSSKRIDIYDALYDSWSIDSLSRDRLKLGVIIANNKLYCGGGLIWDSSTNWWAETNSVEIRDLATNTTSFDCLPEAKSYVTAVRKANEIIFFGGERFDIYDLNTNSWSIGVLPQNPGGSIISYNDILYVTNGNQVWRLEF